MDQNALHDLAARLRGTAVTRTDAAYDDTRRVWNGTVDKRPEVVVICHGVADVIDALAFARGQGLPVAVRGGGHHVAGSSVLHDGLVLDLSGMRSVTVDPTSRTVRAEGGALIGDLDRETQAFNLAVPMGVVSATGIAGLTLAGGFGWLRRRYGLSCDNLISASVVTADGRYLTASAEQHPDLFWALRGGGWDLGVVTSFEFQAYPLGPEVMVAFATYPMSEARQVLEGFDRFGRTAPEEASPIAVFWTFPHSESFPEEVWGRQFVAVAGPYAGPPEEGERVLQPLRELGTPLLDMSARMPYLAAQRLFDEDYPKGRRYYWKSTFLKGLDSAGIDLLIGLGSNRPSPITSLDLWLLGGAVAKVTDSPVGHRDAGYLIGLESNWDDPTQDAPNIEWARDGVRQLAPFSTGGSYLNFEDLSEAGAAAASHGASFQRLLEVKRAYDPENLFRSRTGGG